MSTDSEKQIVSFDHIHEATRARAGSLSAHGLSVQQIADTLLLAPEDVLAAQNSIEYKRKYADTAEEIIQRQIDLDEGWDTIETKAVASILETMQYNRDPKYTLLTARIANAAKRHARRGPEHVIDASKVSQTNVIVLNVNKTYVNKITNNLAQDRAAIDVTPRDGQSSQPLKVVDLPTPKHVDALLAPVKQIKKDRALTELEEAFEVSGVFKDDDVI